MKIKELIKELSLFNEELEINFSHCVEHVKDDIRLYSNDVVEVIKDYKDSVTICCDSKFNETRCVVTYYDDDCEFVNYTYDEDIDIDDAIIMANNFNSRNTKYHNFDAYAYIAFEIDLKKIGIE